MYKLKKKYMTSYNYCLDIIETMVIEVFSLTLTGSGGLCRKKKLLLILDEILTGRVKAKKW